LILAGSWAGADSEGLPEGSEKDEQDAKARREASQRTREAAAALRKEFRTLLGVAN
jgi:hypothetical protein